MRRLNCVKIKFVLVGIVIIGLLSVTSISLATEDIWTRKSDMPTARYDLSTSVVNWKIYAIGGGISFYTKSGLKAVEEYDPATDTWTRKSDMPTGRQAFSTCVVNGKIYAIGGIVSPPGSGLRTVEEYDPVTDTWTRKSNMPTARAGLATGTVNGKIYAIGGVANAPGPGLAIVEEYDPVGDTWMRKTDIPTARHFPGIGVVDGKIYVIGGIRHCDYTSSLSTVEEYDPATDTWTTKASMPTSRTALSASVVNGKIYAIGGALNYKSTATIFPSVEEYNPLTDSWMSMAEMSTARQSLSTSAVNGKIYAIGGSKVPFPWSCAATVEEYDTGLGVLIADFNSDGVVDLDDLVILIENWGSDEPLCDIAPQPDGDAIIDRLDLELFMTCWEQENCSKEIYVNEDDNGGQIELEQGQILVVTLESNPSTGYRWEVVETQESVLEQMGEAEFVASDTSEPPLVGVGGWEIFRFKAISAGQTNLRLVYRRPWEEGVEPINTFSIEVVVQSVEPEEINVDEDDNGGQVELEKGQVLVVTLNSNPTTGYQWELAEIQESILQQIGEAEFKPPETSEPPLVGAGGWEIFRFKAVGAGQMTLKLGYLRPWEEDVEPIKTFSIDVVVN